MTGGHQSRIGGSEVVNDLAVAVGGRSGSTRAYNLAKMFGTIIYGAPLHSGDPERRLYLRQRALKGQVSEGGCQHLKLAA